MLQACNMLHTLRMFVVPIAQHQSIEHGLQWWTARLLCMLAGRKPYVDKLALDKIGAELDERGRIKVG